MKVLVTGGCGFIGSHLVERLVSEGHDLIVIDDLSRGSEKNIESVIDRVLFVKESVLNANRVAEYFRGIDVVVHLAAIASVEKSVESPVEVFQVNAAGTMHALELSRKHGVRKFVYASSAAVYGDPEYVPIDEEHPRAPINVYGISKLSSELLVMNYSRNYGLPFAILRLFNVYGPRMRNGVIYRFVRSLLRGERPTIYGDGSQTRDFVYVSDVVEAIYKSMNSPSSGVYNVGSGREISINQLYDMVRSTLKTNLEPLYEHSRPGDVRRSVADISKAARELGWRPRVDLGTGLNLTIKYFESVAQSQRSSRDRQSF